MTINVKRLDWHDKGIFGHLTFGDFDCVTLERDDTVIPEGTYSVSLYNSPKFKRFVPLIDVPGRKFIEIHPANREEDLAGCIAVGTRRVGVTVEQSRKAFDELMKRWPTEESVNIIIS